MNKKEITSQLKKAQKIIKQCLEGLEGPSSQFDNVQNKLTTETKSVDFDIPIRPFVKKYSKGMSGPKKFTLLVAYLTKADQKKTVNLEEVKNQWNKMTNKALLGMKFNLFYCSSAKDNDWVHTPSTATYTTRPSWKDIFT